MTLDAKGKSYAEFKHTLNARLAKLDRAKHDAVVIKNYRDCGTNGEGYVLGNHFIVLDPKQIEIKVRET